MTAPKISVQQINVNHDRIGAITDSIVRIHSEFAAKEYGYETEPVNPAYMRHTLFVAAGLERLFVAISDNQVVGYLTLIDMHELHNPEAKYLTNGHFYVHPSYRKGGSAAKLMEGAKWYTNKTGQILKPHINFGGDPVIKDKFMQIRGFTYTGGNFIYIPEVKDE